MLNIVAGRLESQAVIQLLQGHLDDMYATSPPESVHALDISKLQTPGIRFWSAWQGDALVGCVALKQHSAQMAEIKSMRTAPEARGQGVGRALLQFLLGQAKHSGIRQLYLETVSMDFFLPARNLYQSAGFKFCGPFADYPDDPNSMFMIKELEY
ncbi:GNAT family N-acetyltransferase [Arsukibacterium indicum]|uniref:GNAT family N-acetyltransferase n=1 Tax=Arsukibacterium indicum TaxID=2848612 RepID=A0ABS6MI37_9GAMM|nr:GNAT family N-acetyltransferase [Arsukibacterium indicum]MBV2128444.1 GNAT family N-acetyltransferase [Arsukibacterium indicum]